jgi:hypothetical protein
VGVVVTVPRAAAGLAAMAGHPEKFWPDIDLEWQRAEMAREQAGRSDLPPRPA